MKILVLLVLVCATQALEPTIFQCDNVQNFQTENRGAGRSGTEDDAQAESTCDEGFEMIKCMCESFPGRDDCDGSAIITNQQGTKCIARNMAGGKGVEAVSHCQRVLITCDTPHDAYPAIRCPQNYKLTGCTFHQDTRHNAASPKPSVRYHYPSGGYCSVKNHENCSDGVNPPRCRVQARCARISAYNF